MKKLIILSILIISIFLTSCTKLWILNPSTITMPDDIEFINLVKQLDTPRKIADYMTDNFTYKVHLYYTPSPYTLWQIKEGDCNDFSTFACFVANYHGYTTYQILIIYKNGDHAIAVFQDINNYGYTFYTVLNVLNYYDFEHNSFTDICDYFGCHWTEYYVYDYSMNLVKHVKNTSQY